MLACRRTTFEWVLRRIALAEGNVAVRGSAERSSVLVGRRVDARRSSRGVRLADGTTIDADLVVVAAGRRSALPDWLAATRRRLPDEEVEDTGIVYFSRFYRLREGEDYPPRSGLIGGDLGYLKYGVFVGDNRTFSLTLATPTDDDELRKTLADPVKFDDAARRTRRRRTVARRPRRADHDDVHVMAGLLNRWRDFVVDGEPRRARRARRSATPRCAPTRSTDAGCSTGFWGAQLIADAIARNATTSAPSALDYDEALRREILPWYRSTVDPGRRGTPRRRRAARRRRSRRRPQRPAQLMRAVFREGLVPALRPTPSCCGPSCAPSTC